MNESVLGRTAIAMITGGKGVLALDESTPTCGKRFEAVGVENSADNRRDYRAMLLGTPGLPAFVSGAILYDETLRQSTASGVPFPRWMASHGILPGIKVDTGAKPLAGHEGESITEGLDGLRERLLEYRDLGAAFAKWRAVIRIGERRPSRGCLRANAHALARYASLCQEAELVPIVEPEIVMEGGHDIARCAAVTEEALLAVFDEIREQKVALRATILKASMVLSGDACAEQAGVDEVAERTLRCLLRTVPAALAGIAFLSGGQRDDIATAHLNAVNVLARASRAPWPISFSFARALQRGALEIWRGRPENVAAAQAELLQRARFNGAAALGNYEHAMEGRRTAA